MSEVEKKVIDLVVDKLNVEASEVTREASFSNDLGADSLDTVELMMNFEKEFNILSLTTKHRRSRLSATLSTISKKT